MPAYWESAVSRGDVAALARSLDGGADVNALNQHGQTAIMNAAHHGQIDLVQLLIARGADLNRSAKYGLTALMLAVIGGHAAVVELLVRAGADITRSGTGAPGFEGKTALDLAAGHSRESLERLLRH